MGRIYDTRANSLITLQTDGKPEKPPIRLIQRAAKFYSRQTRHHCRVLKHLFQGPTGKPPETEMLEKLQDYRNWRNRYILALKLRFPASVRSGGYPVYRWRTFSKLLGDHVVFLKDAPIFSIFARRKKVPFVAGREGKSYNDQSHFRWNLR